MADSRMDSKPLPPETVEGERRKEGRKEGRKETKKERKEEENERMIN